MSDRTQSSFDAAQASYDRQTEPKSRREPLEKNWIECRECKGEGVDKNDEHKICPVCNGEGDIFL